jgi:hypothetical protein
LQRRRRAADLPPARAVADLADPYASSAPGWTFIREGAVLYSLLTWTRTSQTFAFLLPPSSALPSLPARAGGLIPGAPSEPGQVYAAGIAARACDGLTALATEQTAARSVSSN